HEDLAVAKHGDGTVVADGHHGGERVVVAVTPGGGMARPPEWLDRFFRPVARNEPHSEPSQYPVGVEDRGAVDLGECMTQRCEVRGGPDPQRRWCREPLLDRR